MNKTKIYLFPHWAIDVFHRHGLNASSILDFSKVSQYLSLNDISGIIALQKQDAYLLGSKNSEFSTNISYEWSVSATPKDKLALLDQIIPLSQDQSVIEMVQARLFTPQDSNIDNSNTDKELPYTIVHLENNAIAVIFKAHGLTPTALSKYRLILLRDILKQLYVYDSQSAVAQSPLFARYLDLLLNI